MDEQTKQKSQRENIFLICLFSGKNGSEVEIQPGQVFMVIECDKIDRPPCYGFSHDRY